VVLDKGVENRVRDLIADFVRVALRYRLAGEDTVFAQHVKSLLFRSGGPVCRHPPNNSRRGKKTARGTRFFQPPHARSRWVFGLVQKSRRNPAATIGHHRSLYDGAARDRAFNPPSRRSPPPD